MAAGSGGRTGWERRANDHPKPESPKCPPPPDSFFLSPTLHLAFTFYVQLDYFLRDSTAALGKPPIDCDVDRLIHCCRVCDVDGQTQVHTEI